jgi:hypothetical protein
MIIRRTSTEYKRLAGIPDSNLEIMNHPSSIIPDLLGSDHNNYYHLLLRIQDQQKEQHTSHLSQGLSVIPF